ncbi:MAG: ribulose-phosphate 3-epimerase, partial [Saprospiraceae bacterium]|nr:ribulose-phosphate 3-epimerase [Saprospiraceae bacterium]
IEEFRDAGAEVITVHLEACPHIHRTIQQIKSTGAKAGVAVNPGTNVAQLEDVLEMVDLVCVMSVNPGFGGQKFIYQAIPKIKTLHRMITDINSDAIIEVDGGVGLQNAEVILQAGARVLVAGSSVFKAADPLQAIHQLKSIG